MDLIGDFQKSRADYFRRTRAVLNGWKNRSALKGLEILSRNSDYSSWAAELYQGARGYFLSDKLPEIIKKIDGAGAEFRGNIFAGHGDRLVHSVMKEIENNQGLKISVDGQGEPHYSGIKHNLVMKDFLVPYKLRDHNLNTILTEEEIISVAKVITYFLPLNPGLFKDLQINLSNSGCYINLEQKWRESLLQK